MTGVIKRIEFPVPPDDVGVYWTCSDCGGTELFGHSSDCTIKRLVDKMTVPVAPFPTEPGFYWFYGWPWGQDQDRPAEWVSVQVRAVNMGKSRIHVAMGAFWYESEGHVGKWFRAVMPEVE